MPWRLSPRGVRNTEWAQQTRGDYYHRRNEITDMVGAAARMGLTLFPKKEKEGW